MSSINSREKKRRFKRDQTRLNAQRVLNEFKRCGIKRTFNLALKHMSNELAMHLTLDAFLQVLNIILFVPGKQPAKKTLNENKLNFIKLILHSKCLV